MSSNDSKGDAQKREGISDGMNARPLNETIGQTGQGLPDDSSAPVQISPEEEDEIAKNILKRARAE